MLIPLIPILLLIALAWLLGLLRRSMNGVPRTNDDFDLAGLRVGTGRVNGGNGANGANGTSGANSKNGANPASAFYGSALMPKILGASLRGIDRIAPKMCTRGALELFCTPMPWKFSMRGVVPSRWKTESSTFESGALVTYRRRGIGTGKSKVLLVHGWAGSGAQLFRLGDVLADAGYDPVLLDLPAHGRSDGLQSTLPQFQRAIYSVASRIGPLYAIVAHSLGATAAMHATARGLPVERLVLVAPSAPPMMFLRWFAGAFGLRDSVADRMRESIESREGVAIAEFEPEWLGPRIRQSVLVIHDESDRVAPLAASQRALRRMSNARLHITKGLGHRRVLDDRDVASEVVAHLAAA